jgi:hypothetical protein
VILYKYRALEPFRFFVDILLNKRFYAARYSDLNDPMEGQYLHLESGRINTEVQQILRSDKERLRICSLSRNPSIDLMWAHYANGDRGVAIGVKIDSSYDVRSVEYTGPLCLAPGVHNSFTARDILSRKNEAWAYEQETRVFTLGSEFVYVELVEILCGTRMSAKDKGMVQKLVDKLSPETPVKTR